MIKFFTTLFVSMALFTGAASAQTINQAPQNNLQQQGSPTQNTRNVQDSGSVIPRDNSATTLSEAQPESLGVVGNPNQEKPSVTVGRSGQTEPASQNQSDTSRWIGGTAAVLVIGFAAYLYSRKVRSSPESVTISESLAETPSPAQKPVKKKSASSSDKKSASKPETSGTESTETESTKKAPKTTKKKSTRSSRKKRSKNHR